MKTEEPRDLSTEIASYLGDAGCSKNHLLGVGRWKECPLRLDPRSLSFEYLDSHGQPCHGRSGLQRVQWCGRRRTRRSPTRVGCIPRCRCLLSERGGGYEARTGDVFAHDRVPGHDMVRHGAWGGGVVLGFGGKQEKRPSMSFSASKQAPQTGTS